MIVVNNRVTAVGVDASQRDARGLSDATQRYYEVWLSKQRAGKSTALRARARALTRDPAVSSVWILDRTNEWPGNFELQFVRFGSVGDYLAHDSEFVPPVIIWQMGTRVEPYAEVFHEACEVGDVALVIDECYSYAPAMKGFVVDNLETIVLSGRHIQNAEGELQRVHLVLAAQYPKSMHHLMWSQAEEIYCGQISGEQSRKWVSANFDRADFAALEHVDTLERFDFLALREPDLGLPSLPGYGRRG